MIFKQWTKTGLILLFLFMLCWFLPSDPIDSWHLFSPKKIVKMVFALAFIQALGSAMFQLLGPGIGAILTGFLGGLISSTATTASLARRSMQSSTRGHATESLIFLCATFAMLFEAVVITGFGIATIHWNLFIIFLGPMLVTVLMIVSRSRSAVNQHIELQNTRLEILPIIKLSFFILCILTGSKLLQDVLGQRGLFLLTFLVSLFEIHGSVIANVQLHDSAAVSVQSLGDLLALSLTSSYLSKLFLVMTLGSQPLKKNVLKITGSLFVSLIVSWLTFQFL